MGFFGVGLGGFIPPIFTLFSLPLSAFLPPKLRLKYSLCLSLWLRWLSRLLRGFASLLVMTERLEVKRSIKNLFGFGVPPLSGFDFFLNLICLVGVG